MAGSAVPVHLASTSDQFLHEREPPDGKEKPEPACKTGKEGNMATLSRKSSKCDLLDQRSSNAAAGQPTSSSEATSMSGAESGKGDGVSNRDSLSGAVMKDVVFQMEHSGDQQDVEGAAYSGTTEW